MTAVATLRNKNVMTWICKKIVFCMVGVPGQVFPNDVDNREQYMLSSVVVSLSGPCLRAR
jgi:hypothetical protein